jgi:heptosyltransferase II
MKLGIFLPNWVGDAVMATPALRALRRHLPTAEIVGILRPPIDQALAGTPWLDRTFVYQPRAKDPERRGWRLIRRLRGERFDTILLLSNSLRTGLLAFASGAKRRVGFDRYGRGVLLTDRLYHLRAGRRFVPAPVIDEYLKLAYALGCPAESPRIELATMREDEERADAVWQSLGLPRERRVVVLNSGGAYGAAKLWPTEYFTDLARRLATRHNRHVLVVCGPSERDLARRIAQDAAHPHVVSLADAPLSLGLSKACVRRAELMVTTDSGPRHFAAAFDVPVVTLFGPTHIAWSENYYSRAVHLQKSVPCGPCQRRVCPWGHHRCMRELTVDEVERAVAAQLPLLAARGSHAA